MTTASKLGRCFLAVLLSAFVCLCPATMTALAEEQNPNDATTPETTVSDTQGAGSIVQSDGSTTDPAPQATEGTDVAAMGVTAEAQGITPKATTMALDTADSAPDTAAATDDHTFDISNYMELHDAFKYDINSQSNETFTINLTDDITLEAPLTKYRDEAAQKWVFTKDTHNNRYTTGTDALCVKNGNTVTILGHGHSILFTDDSTNNITPGTRNGNLILGAADGSDTLTFNFMGSNHQLGSLVDVVGGTLAVHSGVTLSNNVNFTAYPGGGINASHGAVVTMDGGLIENCSNGNITWGGGVNVDGATFNMTGGTIKGNSETAMNDYLGYGGGVSLGAHGDASTFTMSGNAVIEGNSAPNGGGVYVGPNSTFTMSGNASIEDNTATTYGGGVYVAQGGTFTMTDNSLVIGNDAPYGGGVINFGTATLSNVYDNDAATAGADIYNDGTLTMEDVHEDWSLSKEQATSDPSGTSTSTTDTPSDTQLDLQPIRIMSLAALPTASASTDSAEATTSQATIANPSNKTIDGWYYDGHRETGETDADGNPIVEHNRWNANADTADTPQYLQSYAVTGEPTTETMGLKAAHGATTESTDDDGVTVTWENEDGTVLYTMDDVERNAIPAAEEYNELSGHEDPTEPDENGYSYEFDGWTRVDNPNGNVLYIADYDAVPATHETTDTPTPNDPTPQSSTDEGQSTPTTEPEKSTEVGDLGQTGDEGMLAAIAAGAAALLALGSLAYTRIRASKN